MKLPIPLFKNIIFNDENHTYFDLEQQRYLTSVTTALKRFQTPFPKDLLLNKISKRDGINRFELEQQWEDSGIIGATAGTLLHFYIENRLRNKIVNFPIENKRLETQILEKYNKLKPQADQYISDFKYNVEAQEVILSMGNLAGQCDLLCSDNDGNFIIQDYKTDKAMKTESKRFKGDLNHLKDHTIVKHSLQLSLYRRMLEEIGIFPIKQEIIWFCENNEEYRVLDVPYYKQEAEFLINYDYNK